MANDRLKGCHVLVIEDEYLLADELAMELVDEGAIVIGPVPTVSAALALISDRAPIDGAVLDLDLGGDLAFPVADALIGRRIPTIFTTGYDAGVLPERFAHIARCEKPVNVRRVLNTLAQAVHA